MTQTKKKASPKKKWSSDVTHHSDALDLKHELFKGIAKEIADSLKKSAEQSSRKKSGSYQSAMSMLTFYINRAGKNLDPKDKKRLEDAKKELRKDFGRSE